MAFEPQSRWMELALEQAALAFSKGEVPVGAVLVRGDEMVAMSHNRVESALDASTHAELECLREGAKKLGNWRLNDCTLYCTLEPCIMCYGAMVHFRLGRLVWGAPDLRHGALGSFYDLSQRPHPIHQCEWSGFFMQEACQKLMRDFFKLRRESKEPKEKE